MLSTLPVLCSFRVGAGVVVAVRIAVSGWNKDRRVRFRPLGSRAAKFFIADNAAERAALHLIAAIVSARMRAASSHAVQR